MRLFRAGRLIESTADNLRGLSRLHPFSDLFSRLDVCHTQLESIL